ncbi:5' nucleotidase, NT5C type [Pelotomaculum propionicicum]|uniref:Nucleotidase n=1 Tax=Pelotomaculum propionicicum TaxID=258475 RepID=A0A4Y7RXA3_9FIRM|nr:hypothetical protein [Pelotomaculum propionicicum]NLI11244.1 hypothetical protein [Peptococcaceae bacterium]TEB13312.1 Nucleotidase [Pelotomaculum propionicicum]
MKIGVDIDGVLANSLPLWVAELNNYFNVNKQLNEMHLYNVLKTYEISQSELKLFLKHRGQYLMKSAEPVAGASHYLSRIKQQHEIYIITARDKRYQEETQEWLKKHNLPYDELILLGSHDKKEPCLERNLRVLVEDTLEIGVQVSAAGIPVLLLDAPYNQGTLPELVFRKHTWDEIYQAIVHGQIGAAVKGSSRPAGSNMF